jgi:hypothetical protein
MDNESNIVATVPAVERQTTALTVEQIQGKLADYTDKRNAFRDWILSQAKQDVHFGYPPGISSYDKPGWKARPSLYKAGGDFICDLMRFRVEFKMDADTWKMLGEKQGTICYIAIIRNADSPFYPNAAIDEILGEGRGVFVVGEKKGMGENSGVKMAEKRAKIDAVLNTLGLADLFTQDIEDDAPAPNPRADKDTAAPAAPTRNERAQAKPAAAQNGRKVYDAFLEARPGATQAEFMMWVNSKLAAIGRADNPPTKDSPLTADDADKLIQIINDERGN